MTDPLPTWPPDWLEGRSVAAEEVVAQSDDVRLASALRSDGHVLISVSWPGGRRYLLVDPIGNDDPQALRAGEVSDDLDLARSIDALWSQALRLAKQLIDGTLELPAGTLAADEPSRRRPWHRRRD